MNPDVPALVPVRSGWRRPTIAFTLLLPLLLLVGGSGCAHRPASAAPRPAGAISELHLLSMPVAVNLDSRPGVDGFATKVYAVTRGNPKPTAITRGTLEIVMFDGLLSAAKSEAATPLHRWSFTAEFLDAHQFRTTIGMGYAFTLAWGTDRPKQNRITVIARYLPPEGPPIHSSASVLSVSFTSGDSP